MARRLQIGDVFEIPTPKGLAYAQLTHRHQEPPAYGDLIRVLPGLFTDRPDDILALVQEEERFRTFVPLKALIRERMVEFLCNVPVPEAKREFPIFRDAAIAGPGLRGPWWLWDGKREWRIGELTEEQKSYPICSTWTGGFLVDRIVSGWSHLDEV